jgi:hypothetical protein
MATTLDRPPLINGTKILNPLNRTRQRTEATDTRAGGLDGSDAGAHAGHEVFGADAVTLVACW